MASINDNGTTSITAPQGYAADYCAPYYDLLAKATQQHIAPKNTCEAFRPAPTPDPLLINPVPQLYRRLLAISGSIGLVQQI